jgi:hypothetical protein
MTSKTGFFKIPFITILLTACLGCQLPLYTQWYIENRLPEGVFVKGDSGGVFSMPACSATFYTYISHLAMTYDEAIKITYRTENTGVFVPESNQIITKSNNLGLIHIVLRDPRNDNCPASITGYYQVQVQNKSSDELSILFNNNVIGSIQPHSTRVMGPFSGTISQRGVYLATTKDIGKYLFYSNVHPGWQLGYTPTIYIEWPY